MTHARDAAELVARGVALFNEGRFWDAHEAWEELWLHHAEGPDREFLQGLIQLAAAYVHLQRSNYSGASRLFDAAAAKFESAGGERLHVEVTEALRVAAGHRERIARGDAIEAREFPRLSYN